MSSSMSLNHPHGSVHGPEGSAEDPHPLFDISGRDSKRDKVVCPVRMFSSAEAERESREFCCEGGEEQIDAAILDYILGYSDLRKRPCGQAAKVQTQGQEGPMSFAARNRRMQVWDGFGVCPDVIDREGRLVRGSNDQVADRQVSGRVFTAVPDLSRGAIPTGRLLDVDFVQGLDTSETKRCIKIAEADESRFLDPGVCAVPVEHIVPPWTPGGASSRCISRSQAFQKAAAKVRRRVERLRTGSGDEGAGPTPVTDPFSNEGVGVVGYTSPLMNHMQPAKCGEIKHKPTLKAWEKLFAVGSQW